MKMALDSELDRLPDDEPFSGLVDVWLFLCAASASALVTSAISAWSSTTAPPPGRPWWFLLLTTAIAGLTEVRFCWGHRNYLKSLRERGWPRARWDFSLMCMISACKIAMDVTLANPDVFIICFLLLMVADLQWLAFEPKVRTLDGLHNFKPRFWMWINFLTAVLILAGAEVISSHELRLSYQLLIGIANCLVDICSIISPVGRSSEK